MMNAMLKCAVLLVVLAAGGMCQSITVCQEEDEDIRVDCIIKPKPNQINSYAFSMSMLNEEQIINTNSTTEKINTAFKNKSTVEQLGADGLRMRLSDYKLTGDTTFFCKTNNGRIHASIDKGKLLPCSAISVFLHSAPCLFYSLLCICAVRSWSLVTH